MPDTELIPPIGYGGVWLIVGIALIVVVIATILVILLVRARTHSSPPQPLPPGGLAGLRIEYHGRITEIERQFAAGGLSARSAHQRLSAVVRQYARAISGVDAPVMTLTELQSSPLPTVTSAIAEYYPASFEAADRSEISSAVAKARQVIESWG